MMNKYSLKDIAAECGVGEGAILAYIKYRIESGLEVPNPIPYQRSYYVYDEEGAKTIIELFKNKNVEKWLNIIINIIGEKIIEQNIHAQTSTISRIKVK